jgi:hypothetical protein
MQMQAAADPEISGALFLVEIEGMVGEEKML